MTEALKVGGARRGYGADSGARRLALGSLVGVASFPVAVVILNLIQRDRYSPLAQPMSQLALGTGGWLLTVAFVATGVGLLLLAAAFRSSVPGAAVVPAIFAITGILHFVAAALPTDGNGMPPTSRGLIHNLSGLAIFVLQPIAMIVASFSFRRSPAWSSLSRATLVWSGLAVAAFVLMFVLAAANFFGLGQRIAEVTWLPWLLLVAWRATRADW